MWKRALVCLAFATWCFLNSWVELAQGEVPYFARFDPRATVAWPIVCWETVLALAMLAAWEFLRNRNPGRLPHLLFLACCAAPLGIAAVALLRLLPVDLAPLVRNRLFWPVAILAGLAPAALAWHMPRRASRGMRAFFLYSWPVLLLILAQAVRLGLWHSGSEYADGNLAAKLTAAPKVRVIWVVFDELSRKVAFDGRPAGLTLPNFDRLRAESLYATTAHPPGEFTETSMPSLIFGETVTEATELGPAELQVKNAAGQFGWSARPNIFDQARAMGYNTALIGWFHPYGRVLNRSLTDAFWVASWLNPGVEEAADRLSLLGNMRFRMKMQIAGFPLLGHIPALSPGRWRRLERIKRFGYLMAHAERVAADASVGLALLHLSVPHPPPIYDRKRRAMAPEGGNSYLDSLALADEALGTLRRRMEQAGVWDGTALVVSADHGWRTHLWRGKPGWTAEDESIPREGTMDVPFLVKMPGQDSPVVYEKPFNTVVTRAVITGILSGKLTKAAELPGAIEGEGR